MSCQDRRWLLQVYADDAIAIDVNDLLLLERHLEDCPDCTAALEEMRRLSRAVKTSGIYHEMPANLSARVRTAVLQEAGVNEPLPPIAPSKRERVAWWRPTAIAVAAALILAVFAWRWLPYSARPGEQNQLLVQEVLDNHVRSMMADHLVDVPSSDQHTVKPWFDGKLDFAPPVIDLTSDGFELTGGRLDYIDGRPVATVVYRRRKHIVNLSMWPGNETAPLSAIMRNGYNLLQWKERGMEYWAVSDLNVQELREFVSLIRSREPAASK